MLKKKRKESDKTPPTPSSSATDDTKRRKSMSNKQSTTIIKNLAESNDSSNDDIGRQEFSIDMNDAMILFDFIGGSGDPFITTKIKGIESRALENGANVILKTTSESLGSLFDMEILENPVDDLYMITSYWRVMGMCPYLLISNNNRLYIRIPPPTKDVHMKVIATAYSYVVHLKSVPGYENPLFNTNKNGGNNGESKNKIVPFINEIKSEHKDQKAYIPSGTVFKNGDYTSKKITNNPLRRSFFEPHNDDSDATHKKKIYIVKSGVFLWKDRQTPRKDNGGLIISTLRNINDQYKRLDLRDRIDIQTLRDQSRSHIYTSKSEQTAKSSSNSKKNNFGGNPGEQVPMSQLLGAEEDCGYDYAGNRVEPSATDEDWKTILETRDAFSSKVSSGTPLELNRANQQNSTFTSPIKHVLRDDERVVGSNSSSRNHITDSVVQRYRETIAAIIGERSGTYAQTVQDVKMEAERLKTKVSEVRNAVGKAWSHFYTVVTYDTHKDSTINKIINDERNIPNEDELKIFREMSFVEVNFIQIPEIPSMKEVILLRDLNAIDDQELFAIVRKDVGLNPLEIKLKGLTSNPFVLPSTLDKEKIDIERERLKLEWEKIRVQERISLNQNRNQDKTGDAGEPPETDKEKNKEEKPERKTPEEKQKGKETERKTSEEKQKGKETGRKTSEEKQKKKGKK